MKMRETATSHVNSLGISYGYDTEVFIPPLRISVLTKVSLLSRISLAPADPPRTRKSWRPCLGVALQVEYL